MNNNNKLKHPATNDSLEDQIDVIKYKEDVADKNFETSHGSLKKSL
jgi:hypothetical protein